MVLAESAAMSETTVATLADLSATKPGAIHGTIPQPPCCGQTDEPPEQSHRFGTVVNPDGISTPRPLPNTS